MSSVEEVGYGIVNRIRSIAVKWGCEEALGWKHDINFIRFIGINAINSKPYLIARALIPFIYED